MASPYDDALWEQAHDRHSPPPHLVEFVSGLGAVQSALDLGCGDGALTEHLSACDLVAADVSKVALERAQRRLLNATLTELDPGCALPFSDSSFDLVLCAECLEHVQDIQMLVSEIRRVLRPRGRLAITTPAHGRLTLLRALLFGLESEFDPLAPHLRFFSKGFLRSFLESMGFDIVSATRRRGSLLFVASR
jgi:ubiquinone/menaquinone biosynthesis C-methylase UbiE